MHVQIEYPVRVNRALYAFRDSDCTTNAYQTGLTAAIEMNALHNFTQMAGGDKRPSLLLLLMVAHHAVEAGERNSCTNVVFHFEEVFEMVEIMTMTSLETRMHVLMALESWLIFTGAKDMLYVNNAKLEIIAAEVQETWLTSYPPRE